MNNEEKILEMLTKLTEKVDGIEADVSELKADVKVLDERSLKSAVLLETEVARDTRLLYEGYSEPRRELSTLATKEQAEKLSGDVEVIKDVVRRHSGDISKLKKAQ